MTEWHDLKTPLRRLLGPDSMLRFYRREDWLFVSDAPRRRPQQAEALVRSLEEDGWQVLEAGGLFLIDPDRGRWLDLIRAVPGEPLPQAQETSLPLYSMARRMTRAAVSAEDQPIAPLRLMVKAVGRKDGSAVLRLMPAMLAELQRRRQPMPEAAGWMLVWAMNRHLFERGRGAV